MSNYYIKAILLDNCSYSIAANNLIKNYNIPSKIININTNEKDKFVTEQIDTFPQIYLKKYNSKENLLLGGYDDLNYFISTFKSQKLSDENIDDFSKKYKWSKKAILRLIQLIN